MAGFDRHADGVTVPFDDGREARGDPLVAADGIGSTSRSVLPDVRATTMPPGSIRPEVTRPGGSVYGSRQLKPKVISNMI
jgi:2-polyprenyl-6-methoxyphenol hydroxylase-like FAD-dependent oxidoreductase